MPLGKQQAFELHNFNRLKTGRKTKLQMERRTTVHDTSLSLPFFSLPLSSAHSKCLTGSLRKASPLLFPWQLACIGIDDISWSPTYIALKMLSPVNFACAASLAERWRHFSHSGADMLHTCILSNAEDITSDQVFEYCVKGKKGNEIGLVFNTTSSPHWACFSWGSPPGKGDSFSLSPSVCSQEIVESKGSLAYNIKNEKNWIKLTKGLGKSWSADFPGVWFVYLSYLYDLMHHHSFSSAFRLQTCFKEREWSAALFRLSSKTFLSNTVPTPHTFILPPL